MTDPSPADTGADSSRWRCENCGGQHDHDTESCCSSHNRRLCHQCYRRTHFVDVCGCPRCTAPASTPDGRTVTVAGMTFDRPDPRQPAIGGWVHDDGTPCPEYLAPDNGTRYWCTTHEQHVRRPFASTSQPASAGAAEWPVYDMGWMSLSIETQDAIVRAHAAERLAVIRADFERWAADQAEADHYGQSAGRVPLDPADVHGIFSALDRLTAERDQFRDSALMYAAELDRFKPQPMSQNCRDGKHGGINDEQCSNCRCLCHRAEAARDDAQARAKYHQDRHGEAWREVLSTRAERDAQSQRADRMAEEAQHWAARYAGVVDERDQWRSLCGDAQANVTEALAQRDEARAALERVRALHTEAHLRPVVGGAPGTDYIAGYTAAVIAAIEALATPADASGEG